MDCIAVYSAGFHNVVASSGTAFSETQVRLLARFSKDIVVNFDPDTAGAAATDRSLGTLLQEEFKIKILRLDEGFDPDLFIRKRGREAYAQALKRAPNFFDYLVDRALHSFPVRTPEGKKNAVNYLLPHIQRLPNRIEREGLANDIAQKLGIDSAVLRQEFRFAATHRGTPAVRANAQPAITPSEKVLLRALSASRLEDAALRHSAQEALERERLHVGLGTETLFQVLLDHAGAAGDVMSLPWQEADRATLAAILMDEEQTLTEELLEGALEALRHRAQLGQRDRDIKLRILEAERNNDVAGLLRLKQEKLELDRKLAEGLS
jgi:DNA primase